MIIWYFLKSIWFFFSNIPRLFYFLYLHLYFAKIPEIMSK
eukprot:UN08272